MRTDTETSEDGASRDASTNSEPRISSQYDPLDVDVPVGPIASPHAVERHTLEISSSAMGGASITLALQIKPSQSGADSATPFGVQRGLESTERTRMIGPDGKPVYGGYRGKVAEMFLSDLDDFLSKHREWGEIALLKAGKNDHRAISRIKAGEGYRIDTLDSIAETMNKAVRGEISPEAFRNTVAKRAADKAESEGQGTSGSEGHADGKRAPRNKRTR